MPAIPADGVNVLERLSPEAFAGPMVQIITSDGPKFYVLKKVLVERSGLSWDAITKECDVLTLPRPACKEYFSILVKWMYTDSVHLIKDENDAWAAMSAYFMAWHLAMYGACTAIQNRFETFYGNNHLNDNMSMSFHVLPPFSGLFDYYIKILPSEIRHLVSKGEHEKAKNWLKGLVNIPRRKGVDQVSAEIGAMQVGKLIFGLGYEMMEAVTAMEDKLPGPDEDGVCEFGDQDQEGIVGPIQILIEEMKACIIEVSKARESSTEET